MLTVFQIGFRERGPGKGHGGGPALTKIPRQQTMPSAICFADPWISPRYSGEFLTMPGTRLPSGNDISTSLSRSHSPSSTADSSADNSLPPNLNIVEEARLDSGRRRRGLVIFSCTDHIDGQVEFLLRAFISAPMHSWCVQLPISSVMLGATG